jgi:putative SOS response-associated peptidase YedK
MVPMIRQDRREPQRTFSLVRWGLIPSWSKDASMGLRTINAMSETAAEKPAFRDALRRRRCLLPADGFYEWMQIGPKKKQPFNLGMIDDSLFAFAGLWESWRDQANTIVESCTILTTTPNSVAAEVHDRMPVILSTDDYDLWLDPGVTNPSRILDCLKPFDPAAMRKYPVSSRVNRPENDDADCAREVLIEDPTPMLF